MNPLVRGDMNIAPLQAARTEAALKTQRAAAEATIADMPKIEQAAQEFEAVFLGEMLKPMFEEVNEPDPLFGGGRGEQVFNGMLVQQYGKIMAERGGVGLADHVKAALVEIQGKQNAQTANGTETAEETR